MVELTDDLTPERLDLLPALARAAVRPGLQRLREEERRAATRRDNAAVDIQTLSQERARVEAEPEPAPPPPALGRTPGPDGLALWQLVDFGRPSVQGDSPVGLRRRCSEMTAAAIEPKPVPLTRDAVGRLVVIGTRVPLDRLVAAFERGDSPEAIHESYPIVSLGDIYAIFTYCVRHRDDVNAYLAGRAGSVARNAPRSRRGSRPRAFEQSSLPGRKHDDRVPR